MGQKVPLLQTRVYTSSPAALQRLPAGPRWPQHWAHPGLAAGRPDRPSAGAGSAATWPRGPARTSAARGGRAGRALRAAPCCHCCSHRLHIVEYDVEQRPAAAPRRGSMICAAAEHTARAHEASSRGWVKHGRRGGVDSWRPRASGLDDGHDEWRPSGAQVARLVVAVHG